jgi:hypothetical protein
MLNKMLNKRTFCNFFTPYYFQRTFFLFSVITHIYSLYLRTPIFSFVHHLSLYTMKM